MIAHQAEANYMQSMSIAFLFQEAQVSCTIPVAEEDVLFVVPPLGNMMRFPGDCDSCCPCHVFTLSYVTRRVNNEMTVGLLKKVHKNL